MSLVFDIAGDFALYILYSSLSLSLSFSGQSWSYSLSVYASLSYKLFLSFIHNIAGILALSAVLVSPSL